MSCAVAPGNRAFCFGGVFDEVIFLCMSLFPAICHLSYSFFTVHIFNCYLVCNYIPPPNFVGGEGGYTGFSVSIHPSVVRVLFSRHILD
jgi:hypothetical protein